jgi:large subunit ribosomal protein L7/L12
VEIVDAIAHLNLLEVADLNALLKSRLNISDAPVMMAGGPAAAPAAAPKEVTSRSTAVFGSVTFWCTDPVRIPLFCSETCLIGFNADPDPVFFFYLNAEPDPGKQC